MYIDKTKRNLVTKLKKDFYSIMNSLNTNRRYTRVLENNCNTIIDNIRLIYNIEKVLNKMEILEIKEAKLLGRNIKYKQADFNNDDVPPPF